MFEVGATCTVELQNQAWVTVHKPCTLVYSIRNIMDQPPQETQFGTTPPSGEATPTRMDYKLGYEVCVDKKVWILQEQGRGLLSVPDYQLKTRLGLLVVPNKSGSLPVPHLLLKWVPSPGDSGGVVNEGCVLTNAQVYDLCQGQMVTVHTSSSVGR